MCSAIELSKYIVTKCIDDGIPINNVQLQKILYEIQKEYIKNNSIAFEEPLETWGFGFAVRDSYYYFSGYGAMEIRSRYDAKIEQSDREICDPIIESIRNKTGAEIIWETHQKDDLYKKFYANGAGNRKPVSIGYIRLYILLHQ